MICGACDFYFKTLTGDTRGRICEKRPLDRGHLWPIKFKTTGCHKFELAEFVYCSGDESFKAVKTCLKERRSGECDIDCTLGRAIIKSRRNKKSFKRV